MRIIFLHIMNRHLVNPHITLLAGSTIIRVHKPWLKINLSHTAAGYLILKLCQNGAKEELSAENLRLGAKMA